MSAMEPKVNRSVTEWQRLEDDPLLPLTTIAHQLGVSRDSVARWLRQHKIQGCKIGGRLRIRRSAALAFIRSANYERKDDAESLPVL